jgi:hypothetical protein
MTNTVAENLAGRAGDKEKVEKRRALGRGLESLLPGPRVVSSGVSAPGQGGGDAGKQQVPPLRVAQGRNDNTLVEGGSNGPVGEAIPGVIQAVADDAGVVEIGMAGAELRSAGQPGAAVPTWGSRCLSHDVESKSPLLAKDARRMGHPVLGKPTLRTT